MRGVEDGVCRGVMLKGCRMGSAEDMLGREMVKEKVVEKQEKTYGSHHHPGSRGARASPQPISSAHYKDHRRKPVRGPFAVCFFGVIHRRGNVKSGSRCSRCTLTRSRPLFVTTIPNQDPFFRSRCKTLQAIMLVIISSATHHLSSQCNLPHLVPPRHPYAM